MYSNLIKNTNNIISTLTINYIQGPKVEIRSPVKAEYLVEFYNKKTNQPLCHSKKIESMLVPGQELQQNSLRWTSEAPWPQTGGGPSARQKRKKQNIHMFLHHSF
jgi:hypothetical protein